MQRQEQGNARGQIDTAPLENAHFTKSSSWRNIGREAAKIATIALGFMLGGEEASPKQASAAEPAVAATTHEMLLPKDFQNIHKIWKQALSDPREHIQQKLSECLGKLEFSKGFLAVKNVNDEIAKDGTRLTITAEAFIRSEFLNQLGIKLPEDRPIGKVTVEIDAQGGSTVRFDKSFDIKQEISKALSDALRGQSITVRGVADSEVTLEITKADFDGTHVNLEGAAHASIKGMKVTGTLTTQIPIHGGRPKTDFKLDEQSLKAIENQLLEELKSSKPWKDAVASAKDLLKEQSAKYLGALNGIEGYLSIEEVKDSIDKSKKELHVTGDVYILPKFFELMQIEVSSKVKVGQLSIIVDKEGRSTVEFKGAMSRNEAISQVLDTALRGKTVNVNGVSDEPIQYQITKTAFDGEKIELNGPVTYNSGDTHLAATLNLRFHVKSGKVDANLKIDEAAAQALASSFLNDLIPSGVGKVSISPDPLQRGVIVSAELNFNGMTGGLSNVLIRHSGKIDTSKATVKLGSGMTMTFGYFMLSRVEGAYNIATKELTLGGSLTLTGDTGGMFIRVKGQSTFDLNNPTRIVTRGDIYLLTLPAGYSETTLDLKSGLLETDMKIGNGNTKISGHAQVQAPIENTPWKIEISKADVELFGLRLAQGRLLINDDGMRLSTTVQFLGAKALAEFYSDKGLKHPYAEVTQSLDIGLDLGDLGSLSVDAKVSVRVSDKGVRGKVKVSTKFGDASIDLDSQSLDDISLKEIIHKLEKEVRKLGDVFKKAEELAKKAVEEAQKAAEAAAKEAERVAQAAAAEAERAAEQAKKGEENLRKEAKRGEKSIRSEGRKLDKTVRKEGEKAKNKVTSGAKKARDKVTAGARNLSKGKVKW